MVLTCGYALAYPPIPPGVMMAAEAVTVRCPSCSRSWKVPRRDDGTVPKTARCAQYRGGCGRTVKVPRGTGRRAGAAESPAVLAAAEWDPPSAPRDERETAEPCPRCGGPLTASPRCTARVCPQCNRLTMPAGVAAPYERGTGSTREARSQRERDLEALELARRKGIMRGQLDAIAADDRLTPESLAAVEWFAEQVKAATTAQRLDELADLYAVQKIRRRGLFQARPPAITAGYAEDDDGQGDEGEWDDEDEGHGPPPAVALATPVSIAEQQHRAQPQRATWAEAISLRGWRVSQTIGGCQVIEGSQLCGAETGHSIGSGTWACSPHRYALGAALAAINEERGIT
jgi:hypothetical protein